MKPWLPTGTGIWHETLLSVSPGKGSVLPGTEEHQLRCHTLSVSTGLPENVSLPTPTGTTQCSPGRCFISPGIGAHFTDQHLHEQPSIFPVSFFYPLPQIPNFSSRLSKKVSLWGRGDTHQPKLCGGRGTVICSFFPKPFTLPHGPSSPARTSAACSTQPAVFLLTKGCTAQQLPDQLHGTEKRI